MIPTSSSISSSSTSTSPHPHCSLNVLEIMSNQHDFSSTTCCFDSYFYIPGDCPIPTSHLSFGTIHLTKLTSDLAHGRLDHPSDRCLTHMVRHRMLDGLDKIVDWTNKRGKTVCADDGCVLGKMHKNHVPQKSGRIPSAPGSDMACDIGGPMPVVALGGYVYFCLVRDLYTCCRFIFFMKKKSDWLYCFRKLLADIRTKEAAIGVLIYNLELLVSDSDAVFLDEQVQQLRCGESINFRQWV